MKRGIGVGEDKKEGVRLYQLAADQGYAKAQNNLGIMYENGEGCRKK
jgi:TPR repeat protein